MQASGAFVYRDRKDKLDFLKHGQTTDVVGPGRYESPQLSPRRLADGAAIAPFDSTEVRDLTGPKTTFKETPGPGSYMDPALKLDGGVVSGFKSGMTRLHEDRATYVKNPGPGTYVAPPDWVRKNFRVPGMEATDGTSPTEARVVFTTVRGAPSIPGRDFSYGYEEDGTGHLTRLMPDETGYRGRDGDTVGPGRYNMDLKKIKPSKATDFSKTRGERQLFPIKNTPGPGAYEDPASIAVTVGGADPNASVRSVAATTSAATFSSRSRSAVKTSSAFKSTFDRFKDAPFSAPPPTKYNPAGGSSRPVARPIDGRGFGSTAPLEYQVDEHKLRHAPTHLKNPGPAFYGPGEGTKRGAPAAVSGFKSLVDRFRYGAPSVPGPGAYDDEDTLGIASTVTKKITTSSRYGPFGSTNSRFPDETLAGMNRKLSIGAAPGPGTYEPVPMVVGYRSKEDKPSNIFKSGTERFGASLPDVVIRDLLTGDVVDVRPQRPAPGQYDLPDGWNRNTRAPGVKRDGFGTQSLKRLDLTNRLAASNPGPGTYAPRPSADVAKRMEVPTAFVSQARRFEDYKTPSPGPAAYGGATAQGSMLRKSYNVTFDGMVG